MSETSDRLTEQSDKGQNQFYVLKRGLITIAPTDFSANRAFVSETIFTYQAGAGSVEEEKRRLSYDVYHWVQDADHELGEEQVDEMVVRLPYYRPSSAEGAHGATALFGFRETAGAGGATGTVKIMIDYKAPAASGSPLAADRTQTFYYMVYSQKPFFESTS